MHEVVPIAVIIDEMILTTICRKYVTLNRDNNMKPTLNKDGLRFLPKLRKKSVTKDGFWRINAESA